MSILQELSQEELADVLVKLAKYHASISEAFDYIHDLQNRGIIPNNETDEEPQYYLKCAIDVVNNIGDLVSTKVEEPRK
jgi:hypothetical protein